MTKVVAKVQPLTQSQKYFMTAAFILISLMYFLVVWYWFDQALVIPQSSQIQEVITQVYQNSTLTAPLENPILYQEGDYIPKNQYFYQNPVHYVAILVTVSVFGSINIQVFGTLFITLSIIFLTWKLSEELSLHLDTQGDESLFFIKVLVWVTSLAFFSAYWTPWFSPELLYSMLLLAAMYNMFRFYRLRSYPDAAIAIIWLIFSLVMSSQVVIIGALIWIVWMMQFTLLSRKSKVIRRALFLLSISAVVVGSYWLNMMEHYQVGLNFPQATGVQLTAIQDQFTNPEVQNILSEAEGAKEGEKNVNVTYVRHSLLIMLGLGSLYIFYQKRSAGFFVSVAIVAALLFINASDYEMIEKMTFLAPFVVFFTITLSLRIFRRVPEMYRFALSGFFLSMIFVQLFTSTQHFSSASQDQFDTFTDVFESVEKERQTVFSAIAIPGVSTIYDPRFEHIKTPEEQIMIWDNIYKANFWIVSGAQEITPLQESEYFEIVDQTDKWTLYQRTINYIR